MYRSKPLLLAVLAMFLCGLFWSAKQPIIAAYRARQSRGMGTAHERRVIPAKNSQKPVPTVAFNKNDQRPTPGQLTILDKKGQPAGVCPLKDTDVTADIAGFVARVTVKQQFQNPMSDPIEAVYTFPLPEDAAVDDMTMMVGSRVIKGEIKRREEARQIYETAKSSGQTASLLDQERPNIFTQSVANIMPGEAITITISYVNLLKYQNGQYEFVYPMVVGPRYIPNGGGYTVPGKRGEPSPKDMEGVLPQGPYTVQPASSSSTPGRRLIGPAPGPGFTPRPPAPPSDGLPPRVVTDADKITPPITPPGTRAGHDISLTVNIDAGLPLGPVTSPLHTVDVDAQGTSRATVKLKDLKTIPNKDFILRYTAAGSEVQTGVLTHAPASGQSGFFTLILQPPASPPQSMVARKEMVFVIDQTGSQSGWPIEKSKETMRRCITQMNPGDTFQLIGFNTDIFPCFPKPVPNTPANVQAALKFLEPIEGGGGTDILKSVDYALKLPDDPNRLRIICYLTDGYVGNDMQIIDYVQKHRGRARMFPIGIGNGVNRFLIEGMAKEGRGAADFVTLQEDGQQAAQRFYERIARPVLLDPQVDWSGLPVADVYPKQIPDVFSSGPIVIKGRYTKAAEGDMIVRGTLRGQPWSQRIHVKLPAVDKDGSALASVWARQKIEELQSQDWMGAQTGKPNPNIQQQIIQTALDYRLMSQYTSFVAVEQRMVNMNGMPRKVDVPVEMPEGVSYEGIFGEERKEAALGLQYGMRGRLSAGAAGGVARQKFNRMATSLQAQSSAAPPVNAPAPVLAKPATSGLQEMEALSDADGSTVNALFKRQLSTGSKAAEKQLKEMKPEERRQILAEVKLAPSLQGLAEKVKKQGKNGALDVPGVGKVTKGRVAVMVWLNTLPPDGLKKLKSLGFELNTTLTPNKLILGTVSVEKLDALIELGFVRYVEPPKFK